MRDFPREAREATRRHGSPDQMLFSSVVQSSPSYTGFLKWLQSPSFNLQRPMGSVFHKMVSASDPMPSRADDEQGGLLVLPECQTRLVNPLYGYEPRVFVVEHDWAAAFAGAGEFDDGEYRLPFSDCVFEFVINGQRVVSVDSETRGGLVAIEFRNEWVTMREIYDNEPASLVKEVFEPYKRLISVLDRNIRAISIALDSEVATHEVVRAPYKLNAAREKKGKPPISDYHVVSLARRHRAAPLPRNGDPEHGKVRLHFRRGHWRHYENHKTWIKWTLVGNPDLGFINKHYRL
jgi:hypothetical protein